MELYRPSLSLPTRSFFRKCMIEAIILFGLFFAIPGLSPCSHRARTFDPTILFQHFLVELSTFSV